MPKQRRKTIDSSSEYLKLVVDVRPSVQLLQNQISSTVGVVARKDIYNFRAREQRLEANGTVDLSDLEKMLAEMQTVRGSSVKIFHNSDNELDSLMFQDNRMKAYFHQYSDLVMFDATYSLNDRRMLLVIILAIDGNVSLKLRDCFW